MCFSIYNSNKHVIINKEKLDGHIETVTINTWSKRRMITTLQNIVQMSPVKIQFDGYTVRLPKNHKYVSIKNNDGIVFIPVVELGRVLTSLSKEN